MAIAARSSDPEATATSAAAIAGMTIGVARWSDPS
jgi:hypothetical protein